MIIDCNIVSGLIMAGLYLMDFKGKSSFVTLPSGSRPPG